MTEMHPPFVLGHGKTIDVLGVVSCRWNFAEEHGVSIIQLFVLQDCIFDVILGCDFLDETEPFINHLASLHKLVNDGLSGLNVVLWVKAKTRKQGNNEVQDSSADRESERKKTERDARMQRLAASEAQARIGNQDASSQVRSPSPLSTSSSSTSRLTARSGGRPVRSHARDYIPAPTPAVTRMFQPNILYSSLEQQNARWSRYDRNGIQ